MKLFILGHAGSSASIYLSLFPRLKHDHEVVALDLPGHGRRMGEPTFSTIPDMVCDLRQMLDGITKGDELALFGHSMGGVLAHALAADLEATGTSVAHVIISSTCTPGRHHIPPRFPLLSDQELWRESSSYFGGMPEQIATSQELMTLFVPLLRADLGAVLSYSPGTLPVIDAPILAICGNEDIVDREDMEVWRRYTTGGCVVQVLEGSHFHVLQHPAAVEKLLTKILADG